LRFFNLEKVLATPICFCLNTFRADQGALEDCLVAGRDITGKYCAGVGKFRAGGFFKFEAGVTWACHDQVFTQTLVMDGALLRLIDLEACATGQAKG
jgi:hypothetical protein